MITTLKLYEEIFIKQKQTQQKLGQHNILYLIGSRSELTPEGRLNIPRRNQRTYNILSQFGDNVFYPSLYYRGGDMLFDEVQDIIDNDNIDILIGNSAGGLLSFYLSNKLKIPALSINPAICPTSEAPRLQTVPEEAKRATINGKQLVVIGEKDAKNVGGVDGHLTIDILKEMKFEEKGGEILILPDTFHRLNAEQFNDVFVRFYKKFIK